jgi:hypothetical protein
MYEALKTPASFEPTIFSSVGGDDGHCVHLAARDPPSKVPFCRLGGVAQWTSHPPLEQELPCSNYRV